MNAQVSFPGFETLTPNALESQSYPRRLFLSKVKSEQKHLDKQFLTRLARVFELRQFVETGTYLGDTSAAAAEVFDTIHTVELSVSLADEAAKRFAGNDRVHVYQGDSAKLLPEILQKLAGPTLFWLDGHYSCGVTAKGEVSTPILDELRAIKASRLENAVLLIDDLRLFQLPTSAHVRPEAIMGYPSTQQLHAVLCGMGYEFVILGDVGLAYSKGSGVQVSPLISALTLSRLYDGHNQAIEEIIQAEKVIVSASGEEKEVLRGLCGLYNDMESFGLGLHYRFWRGLSFLQENNLTEAAHEIKQANDLGLKHWRLKWYLALITQQLNEPELAAKWLREVLELAPDFAPAKELLSRAPATLKNPSTSKNEGKASMTSLSDGSLDELKALREKAVTLTQAGQYPEGARVCLKCLEHWPEDVSALECLSVCQIESNQLSDARVTLERLLKVQPDHAIARGALSNLDLALRASSVSVRNSVRNPATSPEAFRPTLTPGENALVALQQAGLWRPIQPLRLHLGCGENHFEGYINVDYPPTEHTVQTRCGADAFADLTRLAFPGGSLDEIRSHHVFEHFVRAHALGLLILWHEWLKPGGQLVIETPDIMGCAEQLLGAESYETKQAVMRHAFGSHEAHWANHYDGWYAQKFEHVLGRMGFAVKCRRWRWPHEPRLANVDVLATKIRSLSRSALLETADSILEASMVAQVASERAMWEVWRKTLREFLERAEPTNSSARPATLNSTQDSEKPTVVVKLQGGLGNQMFQYAAGLALARRHRACLKLDLNFLLDRTPRPNFTYREYGLDLFKLATDCEVLQQPSIVHLERFVEKQFHFDPCFNRLGPKVYLDGYWQSLKYFDQVLDEVRDTFSSFVTPLTPKQEALGCEIDNCDAVCLNVRRGDYASNPVANAWHGLCQESYFQEAVGWIRQRVPTARFFVFSDDLEWCRSSNLVGDAPVTFVSHEFAGDRFGAYLQLMMRCRHFILPNSSFGWWAAFLCNRSDKMVIVPEPWFDDPTNDTSDLVPSSWIRLPKSDSLKPRVSVVVCGHNCASYLTEAVDSVVKQTYRDFELLIIDDGSTDGSLQIANRLCEQHKGKLPIRVFHLDDVGPSAARRFGVTQARGRYWLPLDADDRIAPEYLAKTVPILDASPAVGFVYVDTVYFQGVEQRHHQPNYDFEALCRENFISYCSLIRKAAFEDVQGYDPQNWGYCEDWDLWIRLGSRRWFGHHVNEPLFFYRYHRESSLSLYYERLEPIYRAFLISRHKVLYPMSQVARAVSLLEEMPPGWNLRPPIRQVDEARDLLQRYPQNRHVKFFLARALFKSGQAAQAAALLRELIIAQPNDSLAKRLLEEISPAAKQAPLVSVIVPTYNRPEQLKCALRSILNQTFKDFEIVVINDAGCEVDSILSSLNTEQQIVSLHHDVNRGLAAARNTGLKAARGRYIAYLDDDDLFYANHLQTLVEFLKAQPDTVAYTDAFRAKQELRDGSWHTTQRELVYSHDWDNDKILMHNFVPVLCFMHEKAFLDKAGVFDESLDRHEDWDLWIRLSRHYRFVHIPKVTCEFTHRTDGSSMTSQGAERFLATMEKIHARYAAFTVGRPYLLQGQQASREGLRSQIRRHTSASASPGSKDMAHGSSKSTAVQKRARSNFNPPPDRMDSNVSELSNPSTSRGLGVDSGVGKSTASQFAAPEAIERVTDLVQRAERDLRDKDFKSARSRLSDALAILPDQPDLLVSRGFASFQLGDREQALTDFEAAVSKDPKHESGLINLAAALAKLGWEERGIAVLRSALRWHPVNVEILRMLAGSLLRAAQWREAAVHYGKLITRCPDDLEGWLGVGKCLFELGDSETARKALEHVLQLQPGNKNARANLDLIAAGVLESRNPIPKGLKTLDAPIAAVPIDAANCAPKQEISIGQLGRAPIVSIIIPVLNQVDYTKNCLSRLFTPTCNVAFEVLVIDNHSTDETETFCRSQQSVHPNLVYCRLTENKGFAAACNQGAELAKGEFMVFLNNDTEPQEGWLEAGLKRLESDSSIGIVGAKLLYPDRSIQHCGIEFFRGVSREYAVWPLHRHLRFNENDDRVNCAGEVPAVTGACLFISRDLFSRVRGFSPEYPMYFEDTDLCFKVRQAGRKVFYDPKCVVIHYEGRSSSSREQIDALNTQSAKLFFKKWDRELIPFEIQTAVERTEGRFCYLNQSMLPELPPAEWNAQSLASAAKSLARFLATVGPFYMHFGGAGDALLLLSTFLDKHPDAQVVSYPNSIPAGKSFFEAFPSLKRIIFLPKNTNPAIHMLLRMMMREVPTCLGMGATPRMDYWKEWHAKLNIFREYKINRNPAWAQAFRTNPDPKQVVLAPKGSLVGMAGSKRNIIDPEVWPHLIDFIRASGGVPVVIGTPDEASLYPCPRGCEDRRSYCFREQFECIANSAALVGADSWAKTYSALLGTPTIVFDSIKGADWIGRKDPSDHVFLDPWPSIKVVKDFKSFRSAFPRMVRIKALVARQAARRDLACHGSAVVRIAWEGSFLDFGSLSFVNREMTRCLSQSTQVHLTRVGESGVGNGAAGCQEMQELAPLIAKVAPTGCQATVRHSWPPNWTAKHRGSLVVIQPWEFGALPQEWVSQASQVQQFWVPSSYVREVYVSSGVPSDKVKVVPNGIDAKKFHAHAAPRQLATNKSFKFLFVGGTIPRKGADVLLQTYLRSFTAQDDVCLVIKDFGGKSVYYGQTLESQIEAARSRAGAPPILYLNSELSSEEMPGLYTACDCLVHPYRGEGFGLPILEAMACGLPVIVTAGGAADDFATEEFAYRIPATRRTIGDTISGMKLTGPGWLLEPDATELAARMKWVATHREEARQLGQRASEYVRREWTWEKSAQIAAERLQELAAAAPNKPVAKLNRTRPVNPVLVPACGLVGQPDKAREALSSQKPKEAWELVVSALKSRPFHPEALLLAAEIAASTGDGQAARHFADRARNLAPDWKPVRQFLNRRLKGSAGPAWLVTADLLKKGVARLTVCVITRNEERFLGQCLASVKPIADQLVVVDTGSTDATIDIAKSFGAEVYSFEWCDDFSAARNAALEHARGDWVLILDADEELPPDQYARLRADMQTGKAIALRLPLVNAGQENEGRTCVPRLFRNAPGVYFTGRIHEQVFPSLIALGKEWGLGTGIGTAQILHHGYTREAVKDRNKVERNLKLLRLAVEESPEDANLAMNLGLELVRSGELENGLVHYRRAFELVSTRPPSETAPELREALLTQLTSHLYKVRAHDEILQVLTSPTAMLGKGLTASLHFALGLACFELGRFAESAQQMRECLAKRRQQALSPINTDILTAAPYHCLAMSLARTGDVAGAEKAFQQGLNEQGREEEIRVDYAKFLSEQNRPVDGLHKLHELVSSNPQCLKAWRAGGQIALSRPDFLEVASDWTAEAVQQFPNDTMILAQRGEALLLNQQTGSALRFWQNLTTQDPQPRSQAAVLLCELLNGDIECGGDVYEAEIGPVSRAFIDWYQRCLQMRAQVIPDQVNERLERLRSVLPAAARMIEAALDEARSEAPAVAEPCLA